MLFAVTFPLLPSFGIHAIGAGSLAGAVVDALILGRAVAARSSARPFRLMAVPLVLGLPSGARSGWLVTHQLGNDFAAGVVGGTLAALTYAAAAFVFRRETLLETTSLILRSVRAGLGRDGHAAVPAGQPS